MRAPSTSSRAFFPSRHEAPPAGAARDIGWTGAGGEAFVTYYPNKRASLAAIPLEGGPQIVIADNEPGLSGGHVSCRSYERPGWCVWSDSGPPGELAFDQAFAFPLEPEPLVQVYGHMHHTSPAPYSHEPHAVPSRDGERVLWASDWDRGGRAHSYAFVAHYP